MRGFCSFCSRMDRYSRSVGQTWRFSKAEQPRKSLCPIGGPLGLQNTAAGYQGAISSRTRMWTVQARVSPSLLPPMIWARPMRASLTWRSPASALSCHMISTTWATPDAPTGWPFASSPPLGLTGIRPVISVAPSSIRRPPFSDGAEAQALAMDDFSNGKGIVEFHQ